MNQARRTAPPRRIRLSARAQADIAAVLRRSDAEFGASARQRCAALIATALRDLASDPLCVGACERPELGDGVLSDYLHFSRHRVDATAGLVRRPRHLLLYRLEADGVVAIGRLLHDVMELSRHLPDAADS